MRKLLLLIVCLMPMSLFAQAGFGPMRFTPSNPTSTDVVTLVIRSGRCQVFLAALPPREVQIDGNTIRVINTGVITTDFAACIFPVGDQFLELGRIPAGVYTVELYLRIEFRPSDVRLVQTSTLTVSQAAFRLEQVPANSPVSLAALLGLLLFSGWAAGRRIG